MITIITQGRKAPESRFHLCFLLLRAGRRPSQVLILFWCSEFPELCSVTKPKLGLSLGTKVKISLHHSHRFSLRLSGVGNIDQERLDIDVF